jgi:threonine/homoserine/homoserine lactone efflux protein
MTITPAEIGFYALGIFLLFLTPGPVWVALTARALTGGFRGAWPLAVGVTVGDLLWPFLAILGMSWVVSTFDGVMTALRWIASATFLIMGGLIIRNADKTIGEDSRLTRPGMLAGFLAGIAVIIGNPKAVLFYMGMLPGFFDITTLTWADISAICTVSMLIPLAGNLALAWFIGRARALLTSPVALRRTNMVAGGLLICVGLVIPFT